MLKLSICIPTFNRARYLDNLLESLILKNNISELVEIVISDNNSTDDTFQVVEKWMKQCNNIRYFKNSSNLGFDENMNRVIMHSRGNYCWTIGDDDEAIDGSVNLLLDKLKEHHDIYILSGYYCDSDMNIIRQRYILKSRDSKVLVIKTPEDVSNYIKEVNNDISFVFAFITSLVFLRKRWDETKIPREFETSQYNHAFRMFQILNNNAIVSVLQNNFYKSRSSINTVKVIPGNHFWLDIYSYKNFIEYIFDINESTHLRREFGKLLLRQHYFKSMVRLFRLFKDRNQLKDVIKILKFFYISNFKIALWNLLSSKYIYKFLCLINEIKKRLIEKSIMVRFARHTKSIS